MRAQQDGAGRADFLKAVSTLQAGGLSGQALGVAARWEGTFLNDSEVLYRLMSLARAAGDGVRAQHYAVLLLRLSHGLTDADNEHPGDRVELLSLLPKSPDHKSS